MIFRLNSHSHFPPLLCVQLPPHPRQVSIMAGYTVTPRGCLSCLPTQCIVDVSRRTYVPFCLVGVPSCLAGMPFCLGGVPSCLAGMPFCLAGVPFSLVGVPVSLVGVP
ncbi:hypothetical protein EV126DRAFT_217532 [Verticillium dahliae]|nr:hypothetical protein EV126DRAFT_217532 [Verticillium dahliae]